MENRKQYGFRLPPELIDELDAVLRDEFDLPPTRTQAIEAAIREWIKQQKREQKRGRR